jgi:hypothetical protein
MQPKRQRPTWWNTWLPFLLLGGGLVLAHQLSRPPGGHQAAALALALLLFGVVMCWLWCTRGADDHEEDEYGQQQVRAYTGRQQRQEPVMSIHEPWDADWLPWQHNGHVTSIQRRQ